MMFDNLLIRVIERYLGRRAIMYIKHTQQKEDL